MRSKSSPKVFILITNDMMEDRTSFKQFLWRTHIWELFFTPNYSSLPSYLSSPSPSQTNTLPPKTRCSERCATRASLWVPKAWFMPTAALLGCWFLIYTETYWKAKAQPHKSSAHHCAVPHACIYNVTHGREMRASPCSLSLRRQVTKGAIC